MGSIYESFSIQIWIFTKDKKRVKFTVNRYICKMSFLVCYKEWVTINHFFAEFRMTVLVIFYDRLLTVV